MIAKFMVYRVFYLKFSAFDLLSIILTVQLNDGMVNHPEISSSNCRANHVRHLYGDITVKYLLFTAAFFLAGCGNVESLDNLDPEHFTAITQDLKGVANFRNLDEIVEKTAYIQTIQAKYCAYAPEKLVKASITEELLSEDSVISSLATRTVRLLDSTSINPNYKRFLVLKSTNPNLVEAFLSEIKTTNTHRDVERKTKKLMIALQSGFDKQTDINRAAAITAGVTMTCVAATLPLYLTGQDKSGIADDIVKAIALEIFSANLSG